MSALGLWIWDRDQQTQQLLNEGGFAPVWSPDRTRVAFGLPGAPQRIYWQPADGSSAAEVLVDIDDDALPGS